MLEFCGHRLVYREVVETLPSYKKSYLWWCGIPFLVIRLGLTGLKKIRILYFLDLFKEKGENGQCDLVCVEHLRMIVLMVVMLMSYSQLMSVVLVLLGFDLLTLNFLHSSLSVIRHEIFKKRSFLFILEMKEIFIFILKQRKPSNFKRRF